MMVTCAEGIRIEHQRRIKTNQFKRENLHRWNVTKTRNLVSFEDCSPHNSQRFRQGVITQSLSRSETGWVHEVCKIITVAISLSWLASWTDSRMEFSRFEILSPRGLRLLLYSNFFTIFFQFVSFEIYSTGFYCFSPFLLCPVAIDLVADEAKFMQKKVECVATLH